MAGLILIWIRGAGLVGQGLALGGAIFALFVLPRGAESAIDRARRRALLVALAGALLAAAAQIAATVALSAAFADAEGWPIAAVLGSTTGIVGSIRLAAALVAAVAAYRLRQTPDSPGGRVLLVSAAAVLPVTGALVSHAMGRGDGNVALVALGAIHQGAASTWVGGVIAAMLAGARADAHTAAAWLRRFSAAAAASAAVLALTGIALSVVYIGTPGAAIGTSYGAMVLAKSALFAGLLAMAWLNHRAVHGPLALGGGPAGDNTDPAAVVLQRRIEVEAGLAVVALFLAASIGSTPPAADTRTDQASWEEITRVVTPGWPRLHGPTLAELEA